jgi:hypothetical protein
MTLETTGQRHTKITKMKRCVGNGCGKWKPLDAFAEHKNRPLGRQTYCRECVSKHSEAYRLSPEHRAGLLFRAARTRAKEANIPFTITKAWVLERLVGGVSELTGLPLVFEQHDKYRLHPSAPSLDQIVAGKGYTPENTMVVCLAENLLMGQYPMEITRSFCQAYLNATKGEHDGPHHDN